MGRSIVIAVVVLSACGRVGFDPLAGGDGGDDASMAACGATPICPGPTIPLLAPGQGNATVNPADNGFAGSCGGNASPEAAFKLNPIGAGTYTIAITEGGPGLVVVRDGCCTGPELACGLGTATITLARGQTAFLFVESLAPSVTVQIVGI